MRRLSLTDIRQTSNDLTDEEISDFREYATAVRESWMEVVRHNSERGQGIVDGEDSSRASGQLVPYQFPQIICEHFEDRLGIVTWIIWQQRDRRLDSLRNEIAVAVMTTLETCQLLDGFDYRPKSPTEPIPSISIKRCTRRTLLLDVPEGLQYCD